MKPLALIALLPAIALACPLDLRQPIPPIQERSCNRAEFTAVPYSVTKLDRSDFYGLDREGLDLTESSKSYEVDFQELKMIGYFWGNNLNGVQAYKKLERAMRTSSPMRFEIYLSDTLDRVRIMAINGVDVLTGEQRD